jgi:hypothetical protein
MKKSQADPTTAKSLEDKFERGEDVLDYFDVRKARVIQPQYKDSGDEESGGISREGEFQTPRCRSRESSALSQENIAVAV